MTEEEYMETPFFSPCRFTRDEKVHRIVRRECQPDGIFKHILSGDKCIGDDESQLQDRQLLAFAESTDPFDIDSVNLLYSLNKKGRWRIIDNLESGIGDYQDESEDLRVSYLKSIIRDFGWTFKEDKWQENTKSYDTEFVTVENGDEIHKLARKANKYDLIRKPRPPKKSKKRGAVRGDFSDPECINVSVPKVHVLYETTTTVWDNRIRDKCDKKVAHAKRQRRKVRSRTGKANFAAKKSYLIDDLTEEEEIQDFDENYENEDDSCVSSPSFSERPLQLGSFILANNECVKISPRKTKKSKDENYLRWLHNPSYMEFVEEDKAAVQYARWPVKRASNLWKQTTVSWQAELLPYMDMPLPEGKTLEEFVAGITKRYRKVKGIFPEHYLCEDMQQRKIKAMAKKQNAYFIFQAMKCEDEKSGMKVRVSVNVKSDTPNRSNIPHSAYSYCAWNSANLCPPNAFSVVEYVGKNWSVDKSLCEYAVSTKKSNADEVDTNNSSILCSVCFCDADGFALRCGHFFCKFCWIIHSRKSLLNGHIPIYCMESNCTAFLDLDHVVTFLPVPLCEKYERFLWQRIALSDGFMQCRKCEYIMQLFASPDSSNNLAICHCRYIWCLKCKQRAHNPVPCDFATYYNEYLEQIGEGDDNQTALATVAVRKCPKCGIFYTRFQGCSHMVCPACEVIFCDLCGMKFAALYEPAHNCQKKGEIRIALIDVAAGKHAAFRKLFENSLWLYREERKPRGRKQFKNKLGAAGISFNSSFNIYFAALETLELCEAYVTFCKLHSPKGSGTVPLNYYPCIRGIKRSYSNLQFAIQRFRHAVDLGVKSKIYDYLNRLEGSVRQMMCIGYQSLQ